MQTILHIRAFPNVADVPRICCVSPGLQEKHLPEFYLRPQTVLTPFCASTVHFNGTEQIRLTTIVEYPEFRNINIDRYTVRLLFEQHFLQVPLAVIGHTYVCGRLAGDVRCVRLRTASVVA